MCLVRDVAAKSLSDWVSFLRFGISVHTRTIDLEVIFQVLLTDVWRCQESCMFACIPRSMFSSDIQELTYMRLSHA